MLYYMWARRKALLNLKTREEKQKMEISILYVVLTIIVAIALLKNATKIINLVSTSIDVVIAILNDTIKDIK